MKLSAHIPDAAFAEHICQPQGQCVPQKIPKFKLIPGRPAEVRGGLWCQRESRSLDLANVTLPVCLSPRRFRKQKVCTRYPVLTQPLPPQPSAGAPFPVRHTTNTDSIYLFSAFFSLGPRWPPDVQSLQNISR